MRKSLFAIFAGIVVLIVLLGVLIPGCTPTTGTIEVKATLDGSPWPSSGTGAVTYNLTGPGTPPTGTTSVPKSFTVDAGNWTCAYISGGPVGAYLDSIAPSPTQEVTAGGTKTFTLVFKTIPPLDASIQFLSWTINGVQVQPGTYNLHPNDIVDVDYTVHVDGEPGEVVTVSETSELQIHYLGGGEYMWLNIHTRNDPGAVTMTPPLSPTKQTCTVDGVPSDPCSLNMLWQCEPRTLDVETEWDLVICTDYTKSINWLSFPSLGPVLFDLQVPPPIAGNYTLTARSCVDMEGDENPDNDCTAWSSPLTIVLLAQ